VIESYEHNSLPNALFGTGLEVPFNLGMPAPVKLTGEGIKVLLAECPQITSAHSMITLQNIVNPL